MQLGLGVATGAIEHTGYFSVIETVNIVEKEDAAIAGRHRCHGSIDVEAVSHSSLHQVAGAEATAGAFFRDVFHEVIEGYNRQCAFAQVHQNSVDGESMEPRGECGVTSEHRNSPVDLEKCLLSKIFGEGEISDHAHANCEDPSLVLQVEF